MSGAKIAFIVADVPHPNPKYVRGTIVYKDGTYELPNGEYRDGVTDELIRKNVPASVRNYATTAVWPV